MGAPARPDREPNGAKVRRFSRYVAGEAWKSCQAVAAVRGPKP